MNKKPRSLLPRQNLSRLKNRNPFLHQMEGEFLQPIVIKKIPNAHQNKILHQFVRKKQKHQQREVKFNNTKLPSQYTSDHLLQENIRLKGKIQMMEAESKMQYRQEKQQSPKCLSKFDYSSLNIDFNQPEFNLYNLKKKIETKKSQLSLMMAQEQEVNNRNPIQNDPHKKVDMNHLCLEIIELLTSSNLHYERQLKRLKQKVTKLKGQNVQLAKTSKNQRVSTIRMNDPVIISRLQKTENDKKQLNIQYQEMLSENQQMHDELQQLRKKVQQLENTNGYLMRDNQQLQKLIEKERNNIKDKSIQNSRGFELQTTQINNLQEKLRESEKQRQQAVDRFKKMGQKISQIESQLSNKIREAQETNKKIEQIEKTLQNEKQKNQALDQQVRSLSNQNEQLSDAQNHGPTVMNSNQQKNNELEGDKAENQQKAKEDGVKISQLGEKCTELQAEIKQIQEKSDKTTTQNKQLNRELQRITQQNQTIRSELKRLNSIIQEDKKDIIKINRQLNQETKQKHRIKQQTTNPQQLKQLSEIKELLTYRFKGQGYTFNKLKSDLIEAKKQSFTAKQLKNILACEPFYLKQHQIIFLLGNSFQSQSRITLENFLNKIQQMIEDFHLWDQQKMEELLANITTVVTDNAVELIKTFEAIKDNEGTISKNKMATMLELFGMYHAEIQTIIALACVESDDLQHLDFYSFFDRFYIEHEDQEPGMNQKFKEPPKENENPLFVLGGFMTPNKAK